ncbi:MAG: FKBP-type peptidyl-prolyl cis-trans isomerase [Arthrobacter sp.]
MSFGKREYDRQKPEIDFPEHDAPAELVIEDIIVGDGAEAKAGDTVSTHYVGVAFSTGEEFDASWNRGAPLDFTVGIGQVIQGWDQGLLGMKVGGRRRLEIPSHMAYGDRGAGSAIAPGESLIFVVDLLGVR